METWRVADASDLTRFYEGSIEECNRWCKENHLRGTLWCEVIPENAMDISITAKDLLDEG